MTTLKKLRKVEGLISEDVGIMLADFAARVPKDQAIVEIGTFKGRSACYLAHGARQGPEGAHVWAIDPWDLPGERFPYGSDPNRRHTVSYTDRATRKAARYNVRAQGLANDITLVRGFSADKADSWTGPPVGLLFVDGDHTYEGLMSDVLSWHRYLVDGATVIIDDYKPSYHGVVNGLTELIDQGVLSDVTLYHGTVAVGVSVAGAGSPPVESHFGPPEGESAPQPQVTESDEKQSAERADTMTEAFEQVKHDFADSFEALERVDSAMGQSERENYEPSGMDEFRPLDDYTVSELREYARARDIKLGRDATSKGAIIGMIREAEHR